MNPLIISSIIDTVGKVADNFFVSDKEMTGIEIDAFKAETERLDGQNEVNKTEAAHSSVFVAGWRPAVGWVCAASLFYQFILYPLLVWGWESIKAFGWIAENLNSPPMLDNEALIVLVSGMLGLTISRTYEKTKNLKK